MFVTLGTTPCDSQRKAIIQCNHNTEQQIRLCFPWQPHILANRPQESSRPNRLSGDKKHSPQYNKRQSAFGPVVRPFASANNSSTKHKNYRSPTQVKKYVSSHIKLTPHFNTEADIDCSTDALEEVFVEAATISTPQGRDVQTYNFKTNLQIERLVLEKRRLRRTWKKSIIIMIPKPGKDHTIPSSYRPISLLSCLSKLFEKCF